MRRLRLFCTIFIFLSALCSARAQQMMRFADSLSAAGEWGLAAALYEKIVYDGEPEMNLALYKKSQCCMQSANFADAVAALDRISMFAIPADMVTDVMYQKALCNWLNGNAQTAATHIDEAFAMEDSAARGDVNLLAAMIYNECHRFEDGHAALKLWMGENGISSECAAKVAKLYRHAHKKRSETAAMLLSVIPGAGHFYAGKVGEGLLSMVMNAAVISFGVTQFMNTLYLTCFIGAGLPLTYTYEGAANRATELVAEGNTAHINSFNQKIITTLTAEEP